MLRRLDQRLLDYCEPRLVKLQNRTGIPIWKYSKLAGGVVLLIAAFDAYRNGNVIVFFFCAGMLLSVSHTAFERKLQEAADQTGRIVLNPLSEAKSLGTFALFILGSQPVIVVVVLLFATPWMALLILFQDLLLLFAVLTMRMHYHPLIGPTIWEQMRLSMHGRAVEL